MAQTNFTPILLYGSSTPTNVPLAANLTNSATGSEIAINVADKNLFFKDSGGIVNTVPIRQSGTSSNGWLSSTDWNTFNGKAPATSGASILYGNGSGGFSNVTIGSGISFAGGTLSATGSGGTVTSVTGTSPVVSSGGATPAISLATAYGDTLNPYASKTANYILAAPNGSAGVPSFRALVAADVTGLGTMATQNANAVAITGGTLNGVAIGGTTAGDGTFDILTANVSRLGISTATSYVASNGLSSTSTFTGTAPTDGIVIDYSTGYGRFSAFAGDGYQWYTGGIGTTKIMDLSSAGALVTSGTVTANGVLLTGNLGTVTSVTGTSPIVSSGGTTPAISMPAATTSVSGYLTATDWNTFNNKGSGTITSVSGTTGRITSTGGTTPVIDLASGIATAGTNGSSTLIPVVTIDTYGRVTGITTASNPQGTVTSVAALTLGTTGTDLSSTVANGTTTPVITLNVPTASATNRGALSAADWSTFNGKVSSQWGTTGSDIYYNTGNVGVGTNTPDIFSSGAKVLSVYNASGIAQIQLSGSNASRIDFGIGTTRYGVIYQDSTNFMQIGTQTALPISFQTNTTEKMRLFSSGGLSLGNTTDPGANNLSITGKIIGNIIQNSQVDIVVVTNTTVKTFPGDANQQWLCIAGDSNSTTAYAVGIAIITAGGTGGVMIKIAQLGDFLGGWTLSGLNAQLTSVGGGANCRASFIRIR